jgi:hypothetical protein
LIEGEKLNKHVDANPDLRSHISVLWICNDLLYIRIQFFQAGLEMDKKGFTRVHKAFLVKVVKVCQSSTVFGHFHTKLLTVCSGSINFNGSELTDLDITGFGSSH